MWEADTPLGIIRFDGRLAADPLAHDFLSVQPDGRYGPYPGAIAPEDALLDEDAALDLVMKTFPDAVVVRDEPPLDDTPLHAIH